MTDPAQNPKGGLPEDVTLTDLVAGLWGRRWLILTVTVVVGGLGTAKALTEKPTYEFATVVELATKSERDSSFELGDEGALRFSTGESKPVEHARDAVGKLRYGYLPEIIQAHSEKAETPDRLPEVDVGRSSDSLVTLETQAPIDQADDVKAIHEQAVARLQEAHQPAIASERERLKARLSRAQAEVARADALLSALPRNSQPRTAQSPEDSPEDSEGPSDQGATQAQEAGSPLQRQGNVVARRAELQEAAEIARAKVRDYQARLEALHGTRIVSLAGRSSEPLGQGTLATVGLSWVLGAVLGLLGGGAAAAARRFRSGREGGR